MPPSLAQNTTKPFLLQPRGLIYVFLVGSSFTSSLNTRLVLSENFNDFLLNLNFVQTDFYVHLQMSTYC